MLRANEPRARWPKLRHIPAHLPTCMGVFPGHKAMNLSTVIARVLGRKSADTSTVGRTRLVGHGGTLVRSRRGSQ